jgi:hypothetical protein
MYMDDGDSSQAYVTSALIFSKNESMNRSIAQKSALLPDGWWDERHQRLPEVIRRLSPIAAATQSAACNQLLQDNVVSCVNAVMRLATTHRKSSEYQAIVA